MDGEHEESKFSVPHQTYQPVKDESVKIKQDLLRANMVSELLRAVKEKQAQMVKAMQTDG